ncbi:MAG TPA: DUF6427 family protein [Moheibacter sp.]|nr:DUF6427 family protein [Moheibacter sp.]
MLVNLLSRKSFFSQIILILLFLALFLMKHNPLNYDLESALGVFFYWMTLAVSILFFNNSNLIKYPGIALFYFLIAMIVFSDIAMHYRLSISFFASTLIFWRLLQAERRPENKKFLFDIGLLLSLSAFFYPPSFLLLFFLLFAFLYKQTINLKSFILFIIGITLPLLLGAQILFLLDRNDWFEAYQSAFHINHWHANIWGLIPLAVLILIAWLDHLSNLTTQDVNKRHFYFLGFLYFLNWVVILLIFGGDHHYTLAFLGLPIAIFLTRITQYHTSFVFKELFLWSYLLTMTGFYFSKEIVEIYQDLLGNVSF